MTLFQFVLSILQLLAGVALIIWGPQVDAVQVIAGGLLGGGVSVGGGALLAKKDKM